MRIYLIIFLLSLMFLTACQASSNAVSDPNEPNTFLNKNETKEATLGDPQIAGEIEYELLNIRQETSIQSDFDEKNKSKLLTPKNGTFLVLKVKVHNRSNESIRLSTDQMSLIDLNSKQYLPDRIADNWVKEDSEEHVELLSQGISAHGTRIGYLVFDVPNQSLANYRFQGTDGEKETTESQIHIQLTP
ncbi:DUF4352 domain-containing protein [Risungbinella massiliensis]|uniref:DUF4352 domain-containing protein n=1 Tax=Risungbinella massiliensis TaxID=1329796 RepID=UPI0005CB9881|nr:DUF4352 domain-containing protein [Risungbinella massiliensis]